MDPRSERPFVERSADVAELHVRSRFKGLTRGEDVWVWVRAPNTVGAGPWSDPATIIAAFKFRLRFIGSLQTYARIPRGGGLSRVSQGNAEIHRLPFRFPNPNLPTDFIERLGARFVDYFDDFA